MSSIGSHSKKKKAKAPKISAKQVAGICDPFIFALDKFIYEAREVFENCTKLFTIQTELRDQVVGIETPEIRSVPSRLLLQEFNSMISPFYKRIILKKDRSVVNEMHAVWQSRWQREWAGREKSEEAIKARDESVIAILYEKFQCLSALEEDGKPKSKEDLAEDKQALDNLWKKWTDVCSTSQTAALSMKMPQSVLRKAQDAEDACFNEDGEVDLDQAMKAGKKVKGSIKKKEQKAIKKLCKGRTKEEMTAMFGTTVQQAREMEKLQKKQAMYRRREARKRAMAEHERRQEEKAKAFHSKVMKDCPVGDSQ